MKGSKVYLVNLSGKDDEIRETQLELFDDMSGYTNESL